MMTSFFHLVTDLGDSALTGAFTVVTAAYLISQKQKRAALAIILAFCLTAFLITLGKVALYSRCTPAADVFFDLRSPSGHSAISLAVYGTFAVIVASPQSGWRRVVPCLFVSALVILIAASRVMLGYHTASDVIIGSAIGLSVSMGIWYCLIRGQVIHCRWIAFTLCAFIMLAILNGVHFPAETMIGYFSEVIRKNLSKCG